MDEPTDALAGERAAAFEAQQAVVAEREAYLARRRGLLAAPPAATDVED